MSLEHLAVMKTDLGVGALVHRSCLEACGGSEANAELSEDDIAGGGCALCGEGLDLAPSPTS